MDRKIMEFGYEDTDKKIEISIYGLIFEINKEKILDKNIETLESNDEEKIGNEIEELIGKGAIEKINNKRISDGYKEMTLDVEVAILKCIYTSYIQATAGDLVEGIQNTSNDITKRVDVYRRNRKVNNYRRNYRRY